MNNTLFEYKPVKQKSYFSKSFINLASLALIVFITTLVIPATLSAGENENIGNEPKDASVQEEHQENKENKNEDRKEEKQEDKSGEKDEKAEQKQEKHEQIDDSIAETERVGGIEVVEEKEEEEVSEEETEESVDEENSDEETEEEPTEDESADEEEETESPELPETGIPLGFYSLTSFLPLGFLLRKFTVNK